MFLQNGLIQIRAVERCSVKDVPPRRPDPDEGTAGRPDPDGGTTGRPDLAAVCVARPGGERCLCRPGYLSRSQGLTLRQARGVRHGASSQANFLKRSFQPGGAI